MSFVFTEKYSYPYLDILRKYEGKFNKENKTWTLPLKHKAQFTQEKRNIDNENEIKVKCMWQKACSDCGYKYVSKGTNEYNEVRAVFLEYMKSQRD
jgi:hypothetical protein